MILLRNEGYTVPQIRRITNHHDNNIRKWIHRFNEKRIDGIVTRKHIGNANKITEDIERKIVEIASNDPRTYRLKFSIWSLRVLAGYIMEEKKLVGRKHQSYWDKECPGKTWYRVEEFKDSIG